MDYTELAEDLAKIIRIKQDEVFTAGFVTREDATALAILIDKLISLNAQIEARADH